LSSIAKHSADLAEAVVEAEVFPDVLMHMAHPDENVDRVAAVLTREICKHTLEVSGGKFVFFFPSFEKVRQPVFQCARF